MLKIGIITDLLLFFVVFGLSTTSSFALNIDEAMDLGIANSIEVQIENKKTEYTAISKYEAMTDFLPSASLNYRDGNRRTQISSLRDKQKDEVKAFATAYKWQKMLKEKTVNSFNEIAELEKIDKSYIAKVFKLNYVSPDIVEAILKGTQPASLNLRDFIQKTIPDLWSEQREVFGF